MNAGGLVDTGAILAILDHDDRWHSACMAAFQHLRVPLLTSEAVLTQLFHLVDRHEIERAWRFVRSGALTMGAIANDDLSSLNGLMSKYRDRPMDFADATLVHLAQREAIHLIFTIDHDDFETYRIEGRKKFRIVPGREDLSHSR
jgi:predicted nucleic acid-binding protein